ncbi:hypothetical protein F4Z99_17680 [Candidatus Poribacteria bacterium]|nr:hypothetical protein [Candidatus Poribacteria bacterium]MYA99894.1 hypothetical protein [Candidatus Poribacteria bacterium]
MFARMKIALSIALILVMFVFMSEHGMTHNYQNHGYLYVMVHSSAGVSSIGQDIFGDYTEYWTYGSTSLSTPSDIEGDNLYIGQCTQRISVPGAAPHFQVYAFQGSQFFGTSRSGTFRHYTERNNKSSAWCTQESVAFYTDPTGQRRRVDHDHMADVDIPPGGSSVNEPW